MYARAARRVAVLFPKLSRADGADSHPSEDIRYACPYCGKRLKSEAGRNRHVALRADCRAKHKSAVSGQEGRGRNQQSSANSPSLEPAAHDRPPKRARVEEVEVEDAPRVAAPSLGPAARKPPKRVRVEEVEVEVGVEVEVEDGPRVAAPSLGPAARKPPKRVRVEEVEDEDAPRIAALSPAPSPGPAARKPPSRRVLVEEVEDEDAPRIAIPSPGPSPGQAARKPPSRRVLVEEVEDVDAPRVAAPSPGPAAREPPPKRVRTEKRVRAEAVEDEDGPVAGPSRLPNRKPGPAASMGNGTGLGGGNGRMVNGLFVEDFPVSTAGAPLGTRLMTEEDLREYMESCGRLGEPDLLETAEILMTTGLTGWGRTRHLKGPMYKWKGKGVWRDNADLMSDVDKLPQGAKWTTARVTVGEGSHKRTHTIYLRDVLAVIRQLLGARRFKRWMRYAPQRCWTSPRRKRRVYDEMWSGDWWWRMQYLIGNPHGTVVPLIVATDETTLTNNAHGPKAHPVYLSLGNISKKIRRRPTKRAMLLIGYIPVDSFEDVPSEETRQRYRGELLHRSLERIFEPLKDASADGMLAWCADGCLRHVYPIIASWVADYPEQCDIACTTQSGCPKCMQKRKGRGGQGRASVRLRDPEDTLKAIHAYQRTGSRAGLERLEVRPYRPFWADIPHVDIGTCLTPDLLHQLYKGMYEHMRNWTEELLGTKVFDQRFKQMPSAQDLRHFKKGVTKVKVWAGRESRDMMRQFLPVAIDAQAPDDFMRMIRALMDFSYLAHGERLSDVELAEMDQALARFHNAKSTLVRTLKKKPDSFDRMPKVHMLGHYTESIRELGTPDGYSTETPEHLHIIYVKIPWRMSNRRAPFPQMTKYMQRLEAVQIQCTIMDEYYGERLGADEEEIEAVQQFREDEAAGKLDEPSVIDNEEIAEDDDENSDEHDDEDVDEEEVQGESEETVESATTYYPRPTISIARRPTVPRVSGHTLITSYNAPDLIRALRRYLSPKAQARHEDLVILPSDRFDVWHKATLQHQPLSFAHSESSHRDVVRAHPPVRDSAGRVSKAAVFDTALFAINRTSLGLERFRAGCVHAIFTLPPHLQHLDARPLVFMDVYTPFLPDTTGSHRLYSTTPAKLDRQLVSLVLPLNCLAAACHLGPDFNASRLFPRFFFNDFYNHFTFLVMAYWRRRSEELTRVSVTPIA